MRKGLKRPSVKPDLSSMLTMSSKSQYWMTKCFVISLKW